MPPRVDVVFMITRESTRLETVRDCVCSTQDLDAINEPYRPIPSGRITEEEVFQQVYFLLFGGLALAFGCDVWAGHNLCGNQNFTARSC